MWILRIHLTCNINKNETLAQVFPCELREFHQPATLIKPDSGRSLFLWILRICLTCNIKKNGTLALWVMRIFSACYFIKKRLRQSRSTAKFRKILQNTYFAKYLRRRAFNNMTIARFFCKFYWEETPFYCSFYCSLTQTNFIIFSASEKSQKLTRLAG